MVLVQKIGHVTSRRFSIRSFSLPRCAACSSHDQDYRERLHWELQRQVPRRAPQRALVQLARQSADAHKGMEVRLQREKITQRSQRVVCVGL